MGTTKSRKERLAAFRKEIEDDLKKLWDTEEVAEIFHDIVRDPDRAYGYFYRWRDDAVNRKLRLKERIKFLLDKDLLPRDFGKAVLQELENN